MAGRHCNSSDKSTYHKSQRSLRLTGVETNCVASKAPFDDLIVLACALSA